jgi:hypothetical protein
MFELQRKQKELNRVTKFWHCRINEARKRKATNGEIESLIGERLSETDAIEEEIRFIISHRLIRKAERLLLEVPPYDDVDYWNVGDLTQKRFLTPKGIAYIRSRIREEQSAQRRTILELAAPLIGIIGAVTGLLAIILH